MIEAWPNNTLRDQKTLLETIARAGGRPVNWDDALLESQVLGEEKRWARGAWHSLSIPVTLEVRPPSNAEFGWNVLQVAGHPAGDLSAGAMSLSRPMSVDAGDAWREQKTPDAPFVNTRPVGGNVQPYLPGGGLRGALRHTASRLARGANVDVRDPNWKDDPEVERLQTQQTQLKAQRRQARHLSDADVRPLVDELTRHFGSEELCGRVLVSDAFLTDPDSFQLAQTEHHAEDEFTAGVFGSGKFDKQVLLKGTLEFRIVLEATSRDELQTLAQRLAPALELARLGHLPIGGGKWRGAGWVPWKFGTIERTQAGDTLKETEQPRPISLDERLKRMTSTIA